MASQWGSLGLIEMPRDGSGDICWTIGLDDWDCLVLCCDDVWMARDYGLRHGGPHLERKVGDDIRYAKRGELLKRCKARLVALIDEAREEARLLEQSEAHLY